LAALADAVTIDDWRQVVGQAKADALAGDSKAREWLAKYLLGAQPMKLTDLTADEVAGIDEAEAVALAADKRARWAALEKMLVRS
jgi:hypothetical protein